MLVLSIRPDARLCTCTRPFPALRPQPEMMATGGENNSLNIKLPGTLENRINYLEAPPFVRDWDRVCVALWKRGREKGKGGLEKVGRRMGNRQSGVGEARGREQ